MQCNPGEIPNLEVVHGRGVEYFQLVGRSIYSVELHVRCNVSNRP